MIFTKKDKQETESIVNGYEEYKKVKEHIDNVTLFYGNLQEYEIWKGYGCEIINSKVELGDYLFEPLRSFEGYKKYSGGEPLHLNRERNFLKLKDLCEEGIEAIVNLQEISHAQSMDGMAMGSRTVIKGLPIRKK